MVYFQSKSKGLGTRRTTSVSFSSNLKAQRPGLSPNPRAGEGWTPHSTSQILSSVLFCIFFCFVFVFLHRPSVVWMVPTHNGRAICFIQIQMLMSSRNPSETYPEMMFNQVSRFFVALPHCPIKLTITEEFSSSLKRRHGPADTLVLDFQPLYLWQNGFLLF